MHARRPHDEMQAGCKQYGNQQIDRQNQRIRITGIQQWQQQ